MAHGDEAKRLNATLARWHQARRESLPAAQAADAVGVSHATLYRWDACAEPISRRPHRTRPRRWSPELIAEIEGLRGDFPMWGRAKLGPCCANRAATSPTPPSAASSPISSGAWRYEFCSAYQLEPSIDAINPVRDTFQYLDNHHRPHGAPAGTAPAAHRAKRRVEEQPAPQMT
jgi:hypothetical protein